MLCFTFCHVIVKGEMRQSNKSIERAQNQRTAKVCDIVLYHNIKNKSSTTKYLAKFHTRVALQASFKSPLYKPHITLILKSYNWFKLHGLKRTQVEKQVLAYVVSWLSSAPPYEAERRLTIEVLGIATTVGNDHVSACVLAMTKKRKLWIENVAMFRCWHESSERRAVAAKQHSSSSLSPVWAATNGRSALSSPSSAGPSPRVTILHVSTAPQNHPLISYRWHVWLLAQIKESRITFHRRCFGIWWLLWRRSPAKWLQQRRWGWQTLAKREAGRGGGRCEAVAAVWG